MSELNIYACIAGIAYMEHVSIWYLQDNVYRDFESGVRLIRSREVMDNVSKL